MSITRLEVDLLKVKKDLQEVKNVNNDFCKVLDRINNFKQSINSDLELKEIISEEFKTKNIVDIFASIENDFAELRNQLHKQDSYKEKISDFVESLRTQKVFSFEETSKTILFLEELMFVLNADIISIKPQFLGEIDLGEMAIELGLHKTGAGVIVQSELFSEALSILINKKMFRNLIFETSNAKIFLKASNEIVVESDNENIRKISHIQK
ncbi:MAG: hypothetical protein PHX27_01715 [Candidatus ainarchaeum sp.]|nr:hypothetical protein [Candidatus ainarchaeum sp.]